MIISCTAEKIGGKTAGGVLVKWVVRLREWPPARITEVGNREGQETPTWVKTVSGVENGP